MSTAGPMICAGCGRPITYAMQWFGASVYHAECVGPPPRYYGMPSAEPQCAPSSQLTEADVRRIVREELAAQKDSANEH